MADSDVDSYDVVSLLSSSDRDYLILNNGHQVKTETLKGKKVGLYFSASWCGPCQRFTPTLVEVYNELVPKGDFEVVLIAADENEELFKEYFSKMPWLAIPFSDSETRDRLGEFFQVQGIPYLVIFDENGKIWGGDGVELVKEYGAHCHPFTAERIIELKEREETARKNQSLTSILVHDSGDYVISSHGKKVPVSELEGQTVGLYFSLSSYPSCVDFTSKLAGVYEKLKAKGEKFLIVYVSLDEDEETYKKSFAKMPWLALPFNHKTSEKLFRYFELSTLPTLVVVGPDGKTLQHNVGDDIEEYGIQAFPFTPEKFAELEKAREAAQTLVSLLVSGDLNFVIGQDGAKILVSDLVGKNILLYFSAHWCAPCRDFLPRLIQAYHEIKAKDDAFEVIFISSDNDQTSFDEFFRGMPWLALPFGDARKATLGRRFKVQGIPMLIVLGPTGRTVTKEARNLITLHGSDAYPFSTDDHLKAVALKDDNEMGGDQCDFDLHPKYVLKEDNETGERMRKQGSCYRV